MHTFHSWLLQETSFPSNILIGTQEIKYPLFFAFFLKSLFASFQFFSFIRHVFISPKAYSTTGFPNRILASNSGDQIRDDRLGFLHWATLLLLLFLQTLDFSLSSSFLQQGFLAFWQLCFSSTKLEFQACMILQCFFSSIKYKTIAFCLFSSCLVNSNSLFNLFRYSADLWWQYQFTWW